jgi:hypothetical protein
MNKTASGMALAAILATVAPALGAPGECSFTGFGDFPCDVSVDGGGMTFALPDGQAFVLAQTEDGAGPGYLLAEDSDRPDELGEFMPLADREGCWLGEEDDITVCVAVEQ